MNKTILLSIFTATIACAASTATLDTVTVEAAGKVPQKLKNITSNVELITAEEIEERHFTSVTETLSSIAGFGFVQNGGVGTATSLFTRGFDTKYTLVLIDGVRFNDPSAVDGAAQLQNLLVSDVERIEIIKGANPVWGADAAAGVVNIVTKKAKVGLSASAQAESGSFNTRSFAAVLRYGTPKWDVSGHIKRYLSDSFSAQAPQGKSGNDYERDGYQNTDSVLKAGYNFTPAIRLEGEIFTTNALSNYDGYNAPDASLRSKYDFVMQKVGLTADVGLHHIAALAGQSDSKRDELDEHSAYNVKLFKGVVRNLELKDGWDYANFGNLAFGTGQEHFDVRYTKPTASEVAKTDRTNTLFAQNSNSFGGLVVTQALRYDDYSSFGSKTTGKIGAKYTLGDAFVSSNYGTAFKIPTLLQMMNPWGAPNFDLRPENIRSFDVTASHKQISLTYFYNTVQNLINWQGNGYQNIAGTSTLQGYEAKSTTRVTDDVAISAAYTRLYTAAASGLELPRRAHDSLSVNTDWYPTSALHIGLYSSYVGTRFDTDKKTLQTGGYALFNGIVNYKIDKNLSAYARLDNLLDRYYQNVSGYATAGRSVYMGLKASF